MDKYHFSQAEKEAIAQSFPYEYIGGGYFRKKGVPLGKSAETLHGEQVVIAVIEHAAQTFLSDRHGGSLDSRNH